MRQIFLVLLAINVLIAGNVSFGLEIIAHRGASHDAPENTLAAFRLGFEQKADAIELDIHLTRDGKIVVMHDPSAKRTGALDKKLAEMTAKEIQQLNVGAFGEWNGKGFTERPPLLDEVLPLVPDGKRVFIEIKTHSEILPELEQVFRRSNKSSKQMPIITFYYDVARAAKEKFPGHEVSWLHSWAKDKQTGEYPKIDELIHRAKEAKLDGLDLQYGFPIDAEFVKQVHNAGLKLYTWTVDDSEVAQKEKAAGVDGITTNRPKWLREQLKQ